MRGGGGGNNVGERKGGGRDKIVEEGKVEVLREGQNERSGTRKWRGEKGRVGRRNHGMCHFIRAILTASENVPIFQKLYGM